MEAVVRIILAILAFLLLAPLTALYLYSLTASRRLRTASADSGSRFTIEDAVRSLAESGCEGWELVEEAQQLVTRQMAYSRRNSWDWPRRAFERGLGYCHQRSLALKSILDALGIESRPVFARSCRFPASAIHEYVEPERIAGHVWLRVSVAEEERDVCPGSPDNSPGTVHFTPLSAVHEYKGFSRLGGQLGSVYVNTKADNSAVRRRELPS